MACPYCGTPVESGSSLIAHARCTAELERRINAPACARCGAEPEADNMRWTIDAGVCAGVAGNPTRENWCPECSAMGNPPYRGYPIPQNAN